MNVSVLDKGFVSLMSYTPNGDALVVNAARCSFDKEISGDLEDKDVRLLHYLANHKHFLPFRHPSATVRIHAPLFVLRQLNKHQVGMSFSEVSRRYVKTQPEFHSPQWRKSAPNVKQGSLDELIEFPNLATENYNEHIQYSLNLYNSLLSCGAAPEVARTVLPQSMYTTGVWTGTLLAWHHLYKLRTDPHTQQETQQYALAISEIMFNIFPHSWKALNDAENTIVS
jgi:thymidylate synthase (FAD)